MLITNAAHRQKTEKGSVRPVSYQLPTWELKLTYIDAVCAHYGCGKRISEEDKSFRYSKGGKDSWLCSDRKYHIHTQKLDINAVQIVARQMTATNIVATPTPNTAMIMPRRTNARFRTALRIEARNTTVKNTLASILIALERHWIRVGAKKNAVTISRVPHRGVLGMWTWMPTTFQRNFVLTMVNAGYIDVMVSSGRDLGIVLSTSATL